MASAPRSPSLGSHDPHGRLGQQLRQSAQRAVVNAGFYLYRLTVGPFLRALGSPATGCRFVPSCSEYAQEAFLTLPFFRAFGLSVRRVCRCHPWSQACAVDFPPLAEIK